jgi:histidinol-phosphate aminotransferase
MLGIIRCFNGLVIVDEAYVEFADYSLKDYVMKYDNLVVLRTMSKAFGLAGARVGYMVSNRRIADLFTNTIQYPYPVSSLSLKTASLALSKIRYVKNVIGRVRRERERIFNTINTLNGVRAFRSDANFVLFEAGRRYRNIHRRLARKGILVREIGDVDGHRGCLRVSVGTESMNERFLDVLKVVCK